MHHLSPRVPNYNLQRAHDENPMFQQARTFTLAQSVGLLRLALWDEQQKRPPPGRAEHRPHRDRRHRLGRQRRDLAASETATAARLKARLDAWRKDVRAAMPTRC